MTHTPAVTNTGVIEALVLAGDLSKMNDQQKVMYYRQFCESLGVNPLTQPFKIMKFQGKEIMYATKDGTDQLRKRDDISVVEASMQIDQDILSWTVKGKNKEGRTDVEVGSVFIGGLRGEALANSNMKGLTKAKRRLTLSMVGLGMPDESEIDTISSDAVTIPFPEPNKPRISGNAFAGAVERIKSGETTLIQKLRAETQLTDQQTAMLVMLEDQNLVKHDA